MRIKSSVARFFTLMVLPAVTIAVVSYFGGYAVWGERGILALEDSQARLALQQQELAQLQQERVRATGEGEQSDRLGALAIDFEGLKMKAEFKLDAYKLALAAVENARIDATRKLKSLVVIEPATLPETAEYPRRLYNLATLLIGCLLLYGVLRLVIATIREHQD